MTINKDMLSSEDIIPITYQAGTGGNFLCHFIISAKRNIKDIIKLSNHGNAHEHGLKDTYSPPHPHGALMYSDTYKIDYLFNKTPDINATKPYYVNVHMLDINLISSSFKKSIRITYELDDIDEISIVSYIKHSVDQPKTKLKNTIKVCQFYNNKYLADFGKIENMPNVLFISWKELFKGNIDDLITKISTFTGIDAENFSKESLIHWRTKTQYCFDTYTEIS